MRGFEQAKNIQTHHVRVFMRALISANAAIATQYQRKPSCMILTFSYFVRSKLPLFHGVPIPNAEARSASSRLAHARIKPYHEWMSHSCRYILSSKQTPIITQRRESRRSRNERSSSQPPMFRRQLLRVRGHVRSTILTNTYTLKLIHYVPKDSLKYFLRNIDYLVSSAKISHVAEHYAASGSTAGMMEFRGLSAVFWRLVNDLPVNLPFVFKSHLNFKNLFGSRIYMVVGTSRYLQGPQFVSGSDDDLSFFIFFPHYSRRRLGATGEKDFSPDVHCLAFLIKLFLLLPHLDCLHVLNDTF